MSSETMAEAPAPTLAAESPVTPLKLGVRTPPWRPLPEVAAFAARVEELGYDTVAITDSPMLWRDTMCALAVVAMQTERITIGTAVTNPVNRTPVQLASAFRTIAELAPGRTRLAMATGDSAVLLAGGRPARVAEYRDAVHLIRDLLAGKAPFAHAPDTVLQDPPEQVVPIFVAGGGPRMVATAGEIGDGLMSNNKNLDAKRRWLVEAAAAAGRPTPFHTIGVSVHITDDIERDARRLKPFMAKYVQRDGGDFMAAQGFEVNVPGRDFKLPDGTDLAHPTDVEMAIEVSSQWISDELALWCAQNLVVWGDADEVRQRLLGLWRKGVNEVLARTDGAFQFPTEMAERLAAEVMTPLREDMNAEISASTTA
ncbi:putative 5,10-methylenetetrahydromethanopterin reductase [metagenome]|uniref:Putative 5,10-methylenetetrahydromethanopterin reductase n=1 Tax=metagenome TaxID=256318 RepID=A0A2P2C8W4_9ZZZZ